MADIMTRWMRGYRGHTALVRRLRSASNVNGVYTSPEPDTESWPDRNNFIEVQTNSKDIPPTSSKKDKDGLIRTGDSIWIPTDAEQLKLKLLTIAHAGISGHRGTESTLEKLASSFRWKNMRGDTKDFVAECILCLLSKTGVKIPRPLAETLHGSVPNQVIHFDYLFMGSSTTGDMYVLVVKDDLSGYCWLEPGHRATAEHAAMVLARWNRTFTSPEFWVSDQGAHFINETLKELAAAHNIKHRPTVAYCPWANGTVERINRDVLSSMRALLAEYKLGPHDWPSVIRIIQSALNDSPSERLGKSPNGRARTPLEAMTGIRPRSIFDNIIHEKTVTGISLQITQARAEQVGNIDSIQKSLEAMHKDVQGRVQLRRRRALKDHNKATNLQQPNFSIGDLVLVRRQDKASHKLRFNWCGPRRIISTVSPLVYIVQKLHSTSRERVHCSRIMKYSATFDGETVPEDILDLANRTEAKYEVLDSILDISENHEGLWFQLKWDGLPDSRDFTWSDVSTMYQDVPDMVLSFLRTTDKKTLAKKAATHLGISI